MYDVIFGSYLHTASPTEITDKPAELNTALSRSLNTGTSILYIFIWPLGMVAFLRTLPEKYQPKIPAMLKY